MKIEMKLAINNALKNKKRTIFTAISIILCATLIFTTMILTSSIKNGFETNINREYSDYHFILKNISPNEFNKIKSKPYIDKIYVQESEAR